MTTCTDRHRFMFLPLDGVIQLILTQRSHRMLKEQSSIPVHLSETGCNKHFNTTRHFSDLGVKILVGNSN
jgi:hypothetical protein